jgi:pilus assembly protein CpaE
MTESPTIDRAPMPPHSSAPGGHAGGAEASLTVAALLRSSDLEEALKRAVGASEMHVALHTRVVAGLDLAALSALRGDIVLLDVDAGSPGEMQLLTQFLAEHAAVPVLVTSRQLNVAAMREFLRIGVLDAVPQPFDSAELVAALRQAAGRRQHAPAAASGKRGVIVTFIASGGGVGATSLAVQGACALARRKKTDSICVLDLDVQFGSAALLLDAEQHTSIIDLINTPDRFDAALLRGAMVRPHNRFDLLAAPATMYPIDDIDPAAITATIAAASREYLHTLVDLPMLWTHWTHAALRASNVIALVVELTVPSLRQGRRQIDMLRQEELDDIPLVVIANRAVRGLFGGRGVSLKAATTALGRKVDHVVPNDASMQAAGEAGVPLSEASGGKSLEKKICGMMEEILKVAQVAAAAAA